MKTDQTDILAPSRNFVGARIGMSSQDHRLLIESRRYLYHWTEPDNLQRILEDGLLPWNGGAGGHTWSSEMASRPGHVYMMGETPSWDESEDWENPWTGDTGYEGVYPPDGTVPVRVDLSKLSPEYLVADEDHAGAVAFAHDDISNPDLPQFSSLGEWAEHEAAFVDSPDLAWSSVEQMNSLAHRGSIPPEAVSIDPDWNYSRRSEDLKDGR